MNLPSLSVAELELPNKVKAEYRNLSVHDVLDPIVKRVVLSPGSEFRFIQLHKGEKPTDVMSDLCDVRFVGDRSGE